MVITRGNAGDKGESSSQLSETELADIQAKLKQKETELAEAQSKLKEREVSLREEAAYLVEQRKKQDKREREMEVLKMQLEKGGEGRGQEINPGEITSFKDDVLSEIEELRRIVGRLQHGISSASRHSGQPLLVEPGLPSRESQTSGELPKVSFREATESVPSFDGYNVSLNQFIRACRRAKEIVPPSFERNLTKLLINKLRGRAYYAVEDEPCETVTQLIDLLTTAFGSAKTIDQYRGELSTIYIKPNEHMLDYISRVKDLRSAILDAERRTTGYLSERVAVDIDELTARSFCDGLPLQYRLQMDRHFYSSPFEAFAKAKALAKREELDRERYKNLDRREPTRPWNEYAQCPASYASPRNEDRSRSYSANTPSGTRRAPPREREKQRDYDERRPLNANSGASGPSRRDNQPTKWCRYCKHPGHEIEECRKRQYNNSRQNQGNSPCPSRPTDEPRTGTSQEVVRPIRTIVADQEEEARESRC